MRSRSPVAADRRAAPGRAAARPLAPLLLLVAVWPGACVRYAPRPLDIAAAAERFATRSLDAPGVQAAVATARPEHEAPWPPTRWDRADLLLAAVALNPDLAVERATLAAALAGSTAARARPEPTVGLLSEYSSQAAESSPWLLGLALDLPLDFGIRREARITSAELVAEQAAFDYAERLWQVRDRLARGLDGWQLAERESESLREIVADRDEELRLLARRVELGAAARPELTRLHSDAAADRTRLADVERRGVAAHAEVAAAIGLPASALDDVAVDFGELEPDDPPTAALEAWRRDALLARADLRRDVAGYALAEQRLRTEVARQYPELRIGPGYTWERGVVKLPFDLSLALPLFARNRGPIAEAEARREAAGRQLEATQAAIFAAIDRAADQLELSRSALARQRDEPLATARRLESAAESQLAAGGLDRLSLLEARLARRHAEGAVLEALVDFRSARADLETALRRPLAGPETDLAESLPSTPRSEARPGSAPSEDPP